MGVVVHTSLGAVEGVEHSGHQSFLGIPFARPPTGDLRFRPPEDPQPWPGVRDASRFAASAVQGTHPIPGMAASGPRDEDCLYLNVYTPAADGGRRPVLVWIHGGGFTMGSGSEPLYDGGPLAERGDVVVVTIHYRLGALGYLYLGAHGGEGWGATANAGQLDQIAALRWVRNHIAGFGGDPAQVTLFGESAGAFAVGALLAMPAARGLFHRAVLQSGSASRVGDRETASRLAAELLEQLGLEPGDAEELRTLPAEAVLKAQHAVAAQVADGLRFAPVCDGDTLPEPPLLALRAGAAAEIPVVVGTNRDEVKLFNAMDRNREAIDDSKLTQLVRAALGERSADRAPDLVGTYRRAREGRLPTQNVDLLDAIQSDLRFRIPAIRLLEAQRPHQAGTYSYLFSWESPARRGALGSCHALEMPFVFGTLDAPTQDRFAGTGPAAERLSHQMMDAWLAFARTGTPAHPGVGDWPAYDTTRRATMIFDRESGLEEAPLDEERRAWDDIIR